MTEVTRPEEIPFEEPPGTVPLEPSPFSEPGPAETPTPTSDPGPADCPPECPPGLPAERNAEDQRDTVIYL